MHEKKDSLSMLAGARPAALDPDRLAGSARQQADLQVIMNSREEDTPIPALPRPRGPWRIAVPVAGIAAAVAAVVVVSTAGPGVPPKSTPAAAPAANYGPVVLMDLAKTIEQQTATGAYWQVEFTDGIVHIAGTAPKLYALAQAQKTLMSTAARPGAQSALVPEGGSEGFRTPRDRATWQAAGSPGKAPTLSDVWGWPYPPMIPDVTIPPGQTSYAPFNGTVGYIGTIGYTYDQLQQLPTDTAGLRALFDREYAKESASINSPRGHLIPEPEWLWMQVTNLVTSPIPAAVRAAAYRVLAGLPGLVSLGKMTDPLGRPGIGIALPGSSLLAGAENEWIVDPATGALLARGIALMTPNAAETEAGLTAGTMMNYRAFNRMGWSDQQISTK